jgi:hypothetical protein
VTEPIAGHRPLDRQIGIVRVARLEELVGGGGEHRGRVVRVQHPGQEIVRHDPLIVIDRGLAGLLEVHAPINHGVVKLQEGQVELRDDHVLVIA